MRKLKLLGIIVIIMIIALIYFSANLMNQKNTLNNIETSGDVDITKENISEVLNNGRSILEYNGYVYYLNVYNVSGDGFANKICRRKLIENSKEEVLYDGRQYKIGERLIIFNNNLFFNISGQTLYINLDDLSIIKNYNKGVLYSIQDGKIIYEYQGKIYKGEYYKNTLAIKSTSSIATVSPNFMFEDEKNLYFYSTNSDKSKSFFYINKEKQILKILNRMYLGDADKLNVVDYIQSNDNIYIVVEKNKGKNVKEYVLKAMKKDESETKTFILDNNFQRLLYVSKDKVYINYGDSLHEYSYKSNSISEFSDNKKYEEFYDLKLNGKNIELYKNNEPFSIILRSIENEINNVKIYEIGNNIYLKFDLMYNETKVYEHMFFRIKKDGSNLERLNNTF